MTTPTEPDNDDTPTVEIPATPAEPGVIYQADVTQPTVMASDDTALWPSTCHRCQGVIDGDGYCTQCGARAQSLRNHYELAGGDWVGGVCDIGLLHRRNEDALAIQASPVADERAVLVVCDGVTTSQDADVASLAGARAACLSLWQASPQGLAGIDQSRTAALAQALRQAVQAANEAVVAATDPDSPNPASATFAAALIQEGQAYWANLGDSRVYWFPDAGEPVLLSCDHSLAQAQIAEGVTRQAAEASALAHTITKWLGRDAVDLEPAVGQWPLAADGWLMVCSDGLWNYASEPTALAAVLAAVTPETGTAPLQVAQGLVDWANRQGGHDNITVALARCTGPDPEATTEPSSAA
ncbi:MAG: serine/threonine-protein phosphatase [Propionibacteriaceae bacterium]|jgi:serine/threonine protein phosphatase PrpC|nr:serine/threonine-protein phosphatase [Propionibacteriaceae bacterium]